MDISNINTNPYTANTSATPPVDSTLLNNKNKEITEPSQKITPSAQQAFEVNITQEARDMLTAEETKTSEKTVPPSPDSGSNQNPTAAQENRLIVNIVA